MDGLLTLLAVLAGFAAVLGGLGLLAARARRRGTLGSALAGAMAAHDEALHGTAHDTYVEVRAAAQRTVPVRSPGAPPRRRRRGTV